MPPDLAALIGGIIIAIVSTASVIMACSRPLVRWAHAKLAGRFVSMSDQLLAGIWVIAIGGLVLAVLSFVRLTTGKFWPIAALGAWSIFGYGHVVIFTAWRASYMAKKDASLIPWIYGLLCIGAVSALIAVLLTL